jgi:hypothetical protein
MEQMLKQINEQAAAEGKEPFQFKTVPREPRPQFGQLSLRPPKRLAGGIARTAT